MSSYADFDGRAAPSPLRGPLLASLVLHLVGLLLFWSLEQRPPATPELSVRMVRLGGGQNRPGWVDERPPAAEARPAETPARDPQPQAEPAPAAETREPKALPPPDVAPKATPKRQAPAAKPAPAKVPPSETAPQETKPVAAEKPLEPPPAPVAAAASEAGESAPGAARPAGAVDRAVGPRGEGSRQGAAADPEAKGAPGLSGYLSRLENAVQRQFRFPSTASGRHAVYHFTVERDGRVTNLELLQPSELPGLDLAARGAILKAVLPALPPGLDAPRLGVTYTFKDE